MMMHRTLAMAALLGAAASPALAQVDADVRGPYGVLRAGVVADTDLKFRGDDAAAPSTFGSNADFKRGFTGEVGAGYDMGAFRLEGTIGVGQAKIDRKRNGLGFADDGRARTLNLGVSAYFDIPLGDTIVPYVGAGVGASRVNARLARTSATGTTSAFNDKDWGFNWHVDAGLGIKASERTTIEVGARYGRISALRLDGFNGAQATDFRPRLVSTSVMLGLRQIF